MQNSFFSHIFLRIFIACLLASLISTASVQSDQPPELKKVLVLFPLEGWSAPAGRVIYDGMKSVFDQYQKGMVALIGDGLDYYYMEAQETEQQKKAEAIHKRYANEHIAVVVPVGPTILKFVLKHREVMFPGIPVVFCAHVADELQRLNPGDDVTGVAVTVDVTGTIDIAIHLHPGLRRIALVAGTGPADRYLASQVSKVFEKGYSGRLELIDLSGMTMDQLLKKVSELPEGTVILYTNFSKDAQGVPFVPAEALQLISKSANVPLYSLMDPALGFGSVGGRLTTFDAFSKKTAEIVLRVLEGERAGSIEPIVMSDNPAMFNWRELKRWGIAESALPPGSIVRFKELSHWERNRWWIIGTLSFICILMLLISTLVSNLIRRRDAEKVASRARQELSHVVRVSTVGGLAQGLSHEINQPLMAILSNAEAVQQMLNAERPDLNEVREALGDIITNNKRAQAVIQRIRHLVRNNPQVITQVDLNRIATETVAIVQGDARAKGVFIQLDLAPKLPSVKGDHIQLQQVALNLLVNAIEAVNDVANKARQVKIKTVVNSGGIITFSVSDTGTGIKSIAIEQIFDPFFTTKPQGLGLGLSISRSIAEGYGGRLLVSANSDHGTTFDLRLPADRNRN